VSERLFFNVKKLLKDGITSKLLGAKAQSQKRTITTIRHVAANIAMN
jgi:hypothetical protein